MKKQITKTQYKEALRDLNLRAEIAHQKIVNFKNELKTKEDGTWTFVQTALEIFRENIMEQNGTGPDCFMVKISYPVE